MIKTVITAGGIGTRLLTATKEIPKEMLPIYALDYKGDICMKPLFEQIFHQAFVMGIRKYCVIVGKQKRTIEDHFTPDFLFIDNMLAKQNAVVNDLKILYNRIAESSIHWVNQLGTHGFGHAVLMAETFVGNDEFIVLAGDTLILSKSKSPIRKIIDTKLEGEYDAAILVRKVSDPRAFGVATLSTENNELIIKKVVEKPKHPETNIAIIRKVSDPRAFGVATLSTENNELIIKKVVEKPKHPETNIAIMPVYRFKPSIFSMLKQIKYGKNELQLTSGIQKLIDNGGKVKAIMLTESDIVLDVGTPHSFYEAQQLSMKNVKLNPR